MAQFSTYKNLELPTSPEHYNIGVFNKNAMVIDSELHKLDIKNQSQDELLATKESLDSETERASTKENQILTNLTAETERAKTVENTLTSTLESEINRALTTEESIHTNLSELIFELTTRLNTLADSDDTTLDQLSEIVAYIKNNKDLIDGITTSKINVSDIIDNLTSTATDKPLSANQGKILKDLITNLVDLVGNKADKDTVLLAKDGTVEKYVIIKTGYFPQFRIGRTNYGESVGLEFLHGNVDANDRGLVLEAWRESKETTDINFSIRNRASGKTMMIIKSSNSEINSVDKHSLILRSLNEDNTNSVGIRFRVGNVWTNQLFSSVDGEMFFVDSVHGHSLFAVSESKRQIYDYKTNNLQEIVTKNDLNFQPGETYEMASDIPLPGYLTALSTTIFFTIMLPKSAQGRTASVSGNFRIRKNGGYLVEGDSFSNYLVTTRVSGNLLAVDLKKKDSRKFSEENNIIIMVDGEFTISFS